MSNGLTGIGSLERDGGDGDGAEGEEGETHFGWFGFTYVLDWMVFCDEECMYVNRLTSVGLGVYILSMIVTSS